MIGLANRLYFLDVWNPMLDANSEPRPELFVADDLHMNADGYAIWIRIIKSHLESLR